MDETTQQSMDEALAQQFSTYGLITAERTLSVIGFYLKPDELTKAVNDEKNICYAFLQVPVKNILNGIVLHQVKDYREYAQRMFTGFLLSGAGNAPGPEGLEVQPGSTKDLLESERLHLIELGDQFDIDEFEHNRLIAKSQRALIALAKTMQNRQVTEEDRLLVVKDMSPFMENTQALMIKLREYRRKFYDLIIHVRNLMETLTDYHPDENKIRQQRAALYFDASIGEEKG